MSRPNEYTPIILEIGSRFIRAGIAGQSQPLSTVVTSTKFPSVDHQLVIPSFYGLQDAALTTSQYDLVSKELCLDQNTKTLSQQYSRELHKWIDFSTDFETLLHAKLLHLFSNELLVSPRKCKVILVDSNFAVVTKFQILHILLRKLMVKSVILQPESILSTIASDIENALVMDFGWQSFRIDLVIDLRNINNKTANEFVSFSGSALHYKFVLALIEVLDVGVMEKLSSRDDFFELVEQFIMNAMYVKGRGDTPENADFEIVDGINIPNRLQYEVMEGCFFSNDELVNIVDSVIRKATVDSRPMLLQNLVITGGVSNVPGFRSRLIDELRRFYNTLAVDSKDCMGSWSGCSMYVSCVLINQDKSVWKENEITRDTMSSLSNDRGFKLSGFPDSINNLHRVGHS